MPLRVLFLYNSDWSKEINDFQLGLVPSHRLFGLAEMRKMGHTAEACRAPAQCGGLWRWPIFWRLYQALFALICQRHWDCILATHEAAALPLLLLKRLGLLRRPIVVIGVALLHPRNVKGVRRWMWRFLLPAADAIVVYASAQLDWLMQAFRLDRGRLSYVPLGVDTQFFAESDSEFCGSDADTCQVLSVGTNQGKDFATLLAAMPADARLTVVTDDYNAALIRNSAAAVVGEGRVQILQNVPIDSLREMYRAAAIHVIPLLETQYSSGQTVLLENMALGKATIVTQTSATRDYIEDGTTAIAVDPGNVQALRSRLESALADPAALAEIGRMAAQRARDRYSAERTATRLAEILGQCVATSARTLPAPAPRPR